MHLIKEILNSKEFQKDAPPKLKQIIRKINRENGRKSDQSSEPQKFNRFSKSDRDNKAA